MLRAGPFPISGERIFGESDGSACFNSQFKVVCCAKEMAQIVYRKRLICLSPLGNRSKPVHLPPWPLRDDRLAEPRQPLEGRNYVVPHPNEP